MTKFSHLHALDGMDCILHEEMGGVNPRIAIIPVCIVDTWPQRAAQAAGIKLETLCDLSGTFVYKTGQTPLVIDTIPGSFKYTAETQGDLGSENYKPAITFRMKDRVKADGLAKLVLNTPCVVVFFNKENQQLQAGDRLE